MDYLHILTRALAITWRHKYLWLLALLAGEATTIGLSLPGGNGNGNGTGGGHHGWMPAPPDWSQASTWLAAHATLLWIAGIAAGIAIVALFLLSAVANGALVKGAAEHDAERPFGLGQAWRAGLRSFWPVLGLKLFAALVYTSLAIVIGGLALLTAVFALGGTPAAAVATGGLAALALLAAIPVILVLQVALLLGVRAVVMDGQRANDGFRTALHLIRRRLGRVALFLVLVSLADILASFVVGLAVLAAGLPVVVLTATAYFAGGWSLAIVTGIGLGAAWLVVVATFVGGVNAFTSTCWTVAYPRFDLQPSPAVSTQPQPAG